MHFEGKGFNWDAHTKNKKKNTKGVLSKRQLCDCLCVTIVKWANRLWMVAEFCDQGLCEEAVTAGGTLAGLYV